MGISRLLRAPLPDIPWVLTALAVLLWLSVELYTRSVRAHIPREYPPRIVRGAVLVLGTILAVSVTVVSVLSRDWGGAPSVGIVLLCAVYANWLLTSAE